MQAYVTFKEAAAAEFVEKRSRFIGVAAPVKTEDEIAGMLSRIKKEHRDASHNCYAYALRSGAVRYSDDGEPQGTAGVPILEVLRRENIVDGLVVVTRYFGGTLLGAPGLVRAYAHAAKLAAQAAGTVLMRPCKIAEIIVDYQLYDRVSLLLAQKNAVVTGSDFAERVSVTARIPAQLADTVAEELRELSGNKAVFEVTGEVFA